MTVIEYKTVLGYITVLGYTTVLGYIMVQGYTTVLGYIMVKIHNSSKVHNGYSTTDLLTQWNSKKLLT